MKRSTLLALVLICCTCALLVAVAGAGARTLEINASKADGAPGTNEERLRWFKDAKFGMFVHWGPYSQLGGEWRGQRMPADWSIAEWIMLKLQIPVREYRVIASQFNPVKFDAEEWIELARDAGMKYLVITAKHHDGFAMYDSEVSDYNIVDHTPFKRDPMKELSEASRRAGIKFCFYYSHKEDWDHPDGYGNFWDYDVEQKSFDKYLEEKSKPQLRELLTNYGPLGLIWFDRGIYTQEQGMEFVNIVRGLQPACLVNGRVGNYEKELLGDYQNLNDNGMPIGGMDEYWETPQTLNNTWGYSRFDHDWKSAAEVIRRLATIVAKGGNYLLNVGPTGEGVIPEPAVRILQSVGEWMRVNGESIYGTGRSPFPPLPWGQCTVKGSTLYLHVFNWPSSNTLTLTGLSNRVLSAYFLADKDQPLGYQQEGRTLHISVPDKPVDISNTVVVLDLDGPPEVDPPVVTQKEEGIVDLQYAEAVTGGNTMKRFNRKGGFHISKWTHPNDTISWYVDITSPGRFHAEITYAAQAKWQGRQYSIAAGSSSVIAKVTATGDWYEYITESVGTLHLPDPGRYKIIIRPEAPGDEYLMYFKSLRLIPNEE